MKSNKYHGDSMHGFSDLRVKELLSEPSAVYLSNNGKQLIYHQGGDVVIVDFSTKSNAGNVITAYGSSGLKGESGATILGGLPGDSGIAVTQEMIFTGQIPAKGGFFPPATQLYP